MKEEKSTEVGMPLQDSNIVPCYLIASHYDKHHDKGDEYGGTDMWSQHAGS